MSENISTEIKSTTTLNLNKEDLLTIIIDKEEERLYSLRDTIKHRISAIKIDIENSEIKFENDMINLIKTSSSFSHLSKYNIDISSLYTFDRSEGYRYKEYDIDSLSRLSNPKLSIKRGSNVREIIERKYLENLRNIKITLKETVVINKQEIVLSSSNFNLEFNTKLEEEIFKSFYLESIEKLNNLKKILTKLKQELNKIDIKLILIDKDKTIKANFYKKIIEGNPEIKNLLG